jgi:intein/homing endonuclease
MFKLTEDFAEFLGILIGDGYLDQKRGRVIISGNLNRDATYLKTHVKNLIKQIFGIKCISWKQEHKGCFYLAFYSKSIIDELSALSISKTKIPEFIIKSDKRIKAAFMRGLADTDLSLYFYKGTSRKKHSYPIICSTFSNEPFIFQIKELLAEFNIKANVYPRITRYKTKTYPQWDIQIFGKKNLELWLEDIGFFNARILNRIAIWKKQGYCNPGQF